MIRLVVLIDASELSFSIQAVAGIGGSIVSSCHPCCQGQVDVSFQNLALAGVSSDMLSLLLYLARCPAGQLQGVLYEIGSRVHEQDLMVQSFVAWRL